MPPAENFIEEGETEPPNGFGYYLKLSILQNDKNPTVEDTLVVNGVYLRIVGYLEVIEGCDR